MLAQLTSLSACGGKENASAPSATRVTAPVATISSISAVKLPVGEYKTPFALSGNKQLVQRFRADQTGLKAVAVTMVTFGIVPASYQVAWQLHDIRGSERILVAKGAFESKDAVDWGLLRLQLPNTLDDSRGHLYELELKALGKADEQRVIGVPLYSMVVEPVVITSETNPERLSLRLLLEYTQ
jgi:hypothetical protein